MKMIRYFFAGLCVVYVFVGCTDSPKPDDKLPVEVLAVPSKEGWGYEIWVDNKIFIKQNFIPVVSGYHAFSNREQAIATGNLVLKKIKEGKSPMITLDDLKKLGVETSFSN